MKRINKKLDLPKSEENIENYFQTKFILHILRSNKHIKLNDVDLDLTKQRQPTILDLHLLNFNRIVEFENIKDDIYRIVIECIDYDKDPNTYNIKVETKILVDRYIKFLKDEKKRIKNMPDVEMRSPSIDYIKKELQKYKEEETENLQILDLKQSRTKELIIEYFNNIDKKQGWQYAFVSEQDFNLFTDILTNFFENNPYTLPQNPIQLKKGCKTKVAKVLGEIYKDSCEIKLRTNNEFFEIIRVLSPFKNQTINDLYKALTR
jgi:hypothetical protein